MNITLADAVNIANMVNEMHRSGSLMSAGAPAIVNFRLGALMGEISRHLTTYDATRTELIQKFAPKGENGDLIKDATGGLTVADENLGEFVAAISPLLAETVPVEFKPIPLSALEKCSHDPFPPMFYQLFPYVFLDDTAS